MQEHEVFENLHINLQGSWLNGADLENARLVKAELTKAYIRRAILNGAYLQGAKFVEAEVQGAWFIRAHLQGSWLVEAHLQSARLIVASLRGAKLVNAYLQGAELVEAQLQGAELYGTQLQGATLNGAQLQGVICGDLQGYFPYTFSHLMRQSIGQESDLSKAIFSGGLSQERVAALMEGLPDDLARKLREKLEPHVGMPESNELPQDSGAVTGAYTAEEAEQWMAEYEKVMSEIPGDDSPCPPSTG